METNYYWGVAQFPGKRKRQGKKKRLENPLDQWVELGDSQPSSTVFSYSCLHSFSLSTNSNLSTDALVLNIYMYMKGKYYNEY